MQTTSELYKQLLADPKHYKEVKVKIAGVEYGWGDLVSVATSGGLFTAPGIGNCASRQIDVTLLPLGDIPRQAKMEVYVRLVLGEQASEWIPKGVFFISQRKKDKRTGQLSITGYDAMLKAESVWITSDYDTENWPMSQQAAAEDIAYRIGVELDQRTVLTTSFPVDYPVDENGDLTMREVLGYIAVSNAGNWIITDEGKLLLLKYGDVPPETYYLVEEGGSAITFGGDRILV